MNIQPSILYFCSFVAHLFTSFSRLTLLILSIPFGSSVVLAGSCNPAAPIDGETVVCDGDFSAGLVYTGDNLTLELGLESSTTISTLADFDIGVVMISNGDLHLVSQTDISTQGETAAGILSMSLMGDAQVEILGGTIDIAGDNNAGVVMLTANGNLSLDNNANVLISGEQSAGFDLFISNDSGEYKQLSVVNSGNISHTGTGPLIFANGIDHVDITVNSSGELESEGEHSAGIVALTYGDIVISNSGVIDTRGDGSAIGILAQTAISGDIMVTNSGDITTRGDRIIQSSPLFIHSPDGIQLWSVDNAVVENSGAVTTFGNFAHGINVSSIYGDSTVINNGDVTTHGGGTGMAVSPIFGHAHVSNTGNVTTSDAPGIYADNLLGNIYIENSGTVSANLSTADDEDEGEFRGAVMAVEDGGFGDGGFGDFSINNSGSVSADGEFGNGVVIDARDGGAELINSGDIASAEATAVLIHGTTRQSVTNMGTISGTTGGLIFQGDRYVYLNNSGTLQSTGGFVVQTGLGGDQIDNFGTIEGAIDMGSGNDIFNNYSPDTLILNGISTLGAGDDFFNNGTAGSVVFADGSVLEFGSGFGAFDNQGLVTVNGMAQINLGMGSLANIGGISLVDNSDGGTLSIAGDYIGGGFLSIDVNPQTGVSDELLIAGTIFGAPTVLNINYSMPSTPGQNTLTFDGLPFTGDQVVFGELTAQIPVLDSSLSFSNGSFVLDYFAGVSALGLTSSVLGNSAINSFNQSLGLMQDRVGADLFEKPKGKLVTWLRGNHFSRDQSPGASIQSVDFEQRYTGFDIGVGWTFDKDNLIGQLGLMLGQGNSDIDMVDAAGSADLDSQSFGLNASVVFNQAYYVDALIQYSTLEAELKDELVRQKIDVDGDRLGFSLEGGLRHSTEGGLIIHPLAQMSWISLEWDSFSAANLRYDMDSVHSLTGLLGINFSREYKRSSTKVTPYLTLNVSRQFDGDVELDINGFEFSTDNRSTGYGIKVGADITFARLSIALAMDWAGGDDIDKALGGNLSFFYRF